MSCYRRKCFTYMFGDESHGTTRKKITRPTTHQKSRINSIKSWEWAKPLAAKKLTQPLVNQTVKKSH